jgi:hypothetical protein
MLMRTGLYPENSAAQGQICGVAVSLGADRRM